MTSTLIGWAVAAANAWMVGGFLGRALWRLPTWACIAIGCPVGAGLGVIIFSGVKAILG